MSDAYNAPELNNHYCTQLCPLKEDGPTGPATAARRLTIKIIAALRGRLHTGQSSKIVQDGIIQRMRNHR
jgi:hypothetical protein